MAEPERRIVEDLPVNLSFDDIAERLLLEEEEDRELMRARCAVAAALARPKGIYTVRPVAAIEGEQVTIGGSVFRSRVLAGNLQGVQQVCAYVVTCGREVDDWSRQEPDPIVALWLDMVKETILRHAMGPFLTQIAHEQGLERYATMSPGSGNVDVWPIGQQHTLFQLIGGVEEAIGVHLTESCLMLPTKSCSGILYPSEKGFITCTLCSRAHCPSRRAEYDPAAGQWM